MRYPEPRIERRRAKRAAREARWAALREEKLARKMAAIEPRSGEDRRQQERRVESLSEEALSRRLAELGISGDRRRGERRTGGDRRQR
jgi:hypothetical protein